VDEVRAITFALLLAATLAVGAPGHAQGPYFAGNPAVRMRNIAGGGTVLGSNFFAANAKPDGLTLLASPVGSKIAYMIQNPAVRYDFHKGLSITLDVTRFIRTLMQEKYGQTI